MLTFVDTYSEVAFVKRYDCKTPLPTANLLNDHVVTFFDSFGIPLMPALTDRGTEYCGNPSITKYKSYVAMEDINHTRMKARPTRSSSDCTRPCSAGSIMSPSARRSTIRSTLCRPILMRGATSTTMNAASGVTVLRQNPDARLPRFTGTRQGKLIPR
ncbi:hypothetical protein ACTXHA_13690 [Burkholderia cenocepacia]|uniref:hypothetical protein n=1 Tax=Burkholderia cenocepacia TaxID=95486 RepID=UPI002AAF85E6|nr:hypothetical protein [Burkholderia cenocepacia]